MSWYLSFKSPENCHSNSIPNTNLNQNQNLQMNLSQQENRLSSQKSENFQKNDKKDFNHHITTPIQNRTIQWNHFR